MPYLFEIKESNPLTKSELSLVYDRFNKDKSVMVVYKCKLAEFLLQLLHYEDSIEKIIDLDFSVTRSYQKNFISESEYYNISRKIKIFLGKELLSDVIVEFKLISKIKLLEEIRFPKFYTFHFDRGAGFFNIDELGIPYFNKFVFTDATPWFNMCIIDVKTKIQIFNIRYSGCFPGCYWYKCYFMPGFQYTKDKEFQESVILKLLLGYPTILEKNSFWVRNYIQEYTNITNKKNILSQNLTDRMYIRADNKNILL